MRSVMQHSFARNPTANIGRSVFDRSSGVKAPIDADYLYPIYCDFALPGDTMRMNPTFFARMSTPIHPLMDNMFLDHFWFAVPVRTMWENWEKFLGAQDNPGDSIDFTIPTITATTGTGYSHGSLHDFIGIRPGIPDLVHSALWHRAYNKIWNYWFRSQDLQNSVTENTGNGPDLATDYALLKRGKRHDYFTSCLPYPQKGDTTVTMPLGTTAPIVGIGADNQTWTTGSVTVYETGGSGSETYTKLKNISNDVADQRFYVEEDANNSGFPGIFADLSSAASATINAMRLAVTTQQFLERDARGGTRIQEIILSHFGVLTMDQRVQVPEYLGGGSTPVGIQTIPQQSETGTTPQGNLAAMGTVLSREGGFVKSFTEHCVIMCLVNVRADLTYQNGTERMFFWSTRFDLFWPEFQNIGEQAVLQQEIETTNPAGGTNTNVFGYAERNAELKFKNSRIIGKFRSDAAGTLDPWHLSENLSTPALNATFIQSTTPMARVEAVSSEPDFIMDGYFRLSHVRPMQLYGEPGLARF